MRTRFRPTRLRSSIAMMRERWSGVSAGHLKEWMMRRQTREQGRGRATVGSDGGDKMQSTSHSRTKDHGRKSKMPLLRGGLVRS